MPIFWFAVLVLIAAFGGSMMLARRLGQAWRKNRTAPEPKMSFPKWWHGPFVIVVGTALALLEGAGLLGLPRSENDIDKIIFLFFGGLLFGFVLLVWSQFNRR